MGEAAVTDPTVLSTLVDLLSWLLILVGTTFCIIGGIGLVRFPDFYSRIHATGLTDTLGAGLILNGLMLQSGFSLVTAKLVFVLVFLLVTGPTANHALVKAAYAHGIRIALDPVVGDPGEGDPGEGDPGGDPA